MEIKGKMKLFPLLFAPALFIFFFQTKTANLNADFILKKGETAAVKKNDWRVKMISAGQAQMNEGGDRPFCKFEVETDRQRHGATLFVGKSVRYGSLTITLNSVNTKTDPKADDPWSANSCGFVVTKK